RRAHRPGARRADGPRRHQAGGPGRDPAGRRALSVRRRALRRRRLGHDRAETLGLRHDLCAGGRHGRRRGPGDPGVRGDPPRPVRASDRRGVALGSRRVGVEAAMADGERRGPWVVRTSRQVYENPWIRVIEHDVLQPGGSPGIYGVCSMKALAVGIVPVDADGSTWLVGQHRFPRDYYSWELPEGGGDRTLPPIESARRELREETGLSAGGWYEFLRTDLSNAVTDEVGFGFLAWDLEAGASDPDDG